MDCAIDEQDLIPCHVLIASNEAGVSGSEGQYPVQCIPHGVNRIDGSAPGSHEVRWPGKSHYAAWACTGSARIRNDIFRAGAIESTTQGQRSSKERPYQRQSHVPGRRRRRRMTRSTGIHHDSVDLRYLLARGCFVAAVERVSFCLASCGSGYCSHSKLRSSFSTSTVPYNPHHIETHHESHHSWIRSFPSNSSQLPTSTYSVEACSLLSISPSSSGLAKQHDPTSTVHTISRKFRNGKTLLSRILTIFKAHTFGLGGKKKASARRRTRM